MNADFSKRNSILSAPFLYKGFTAWPDFSPDGKSIVFTTDADRKKCHLCLVEIDSPEHIKRLTSPEIGAKRPTWHPGGNKIAYNLNNESIWFLHLITGESKLYIPSEIRNGKKLIHPCFAPDGKSIVVASFQRGGIQRDEVLYRLDPNAQYPIIQLTEFPNVCAGRCTISPNNQEIIFAGHGGSFNQLENRLWKVCPPGKAVVLEEGSDANCHGRCPSYSPDGKWVACVSARPIKKPKEDTPMAVWIISSDGTASYKLTDDSMLPTHMAWSPDQTLLAITGAYGLQLVTLPQQFKFCD